MLKYLIPILILAILTSYILTLESPMKYLTRPQVGKVKVVYIIKKVIPSIKEVISRGKLLVRVSPSKSLELLKATYNPSYVLMNTRNYPHKYIKLISYDIYNNCSWSLSKKEVYIINLTVRYMPLKGRSDCLLMFEDIRGLNIDLDMYEKVVTCFGVGGPFTLINFTEGPILMFNSTYLTPLPPDLILGNFINIEEFKIPTKIIPLIFSRIIPMPKNDTGDSYIVYVDSALRFIAFKGKKPPYLFLLRPSSKLTHDKSRSMNNLLTNYCIIRHKLTHNKMNTLLTKLLCRNATLITLAQAYNSIVKFMRSNIKYGTADYSLFVSKGMDCIEAFIFNIRRGVCTHFASALSIMLRLLGFKTRIAIGLILLSYTPLGNGTYLAIYLPHAWTEVLTPMGYISLDPTPHTALASIAYVETRRIVKEVVSSIGPQELNISSYPGLNVIYKLRPHEKYGGINTWYKFWLMISKLRRELTVYLSIALILALVIYLIIHIEPLLRRILIIIRFKWMKSKSLSNILRDVINYIYEVTGIRYSRNETLREYVHKVCSVLPLDVRELLLRFVSTYEALRFGGKGSLNELTKLAKEVILSLKVRGG